MILPFSQKLNGNDTYFVEKIIKCIGTDLQIDLMPVFPDAGRLIYPFDDEIYTHCNPKRHSLREDEKNRWGSGMQVHPTINNRSKNMLVFERELLWCVSTQEITILKGHRGWQIFIDKKPYAKLLINKTYSDASPDIIKLTALAVNDGFDDFMGFLQYFNKPFFGKIIHWTDLRY